MTLTKKLEQEIRRAYLEYWEYYFTGKIRQFGSLLDDDYKLIGTSEIEIINSKKDALIWLKNSVKEIKGKTEFRNRKIKISPVNDLVLVNELADVYILVDREWKFYSRIRISTFLRQIKNKWKVVQQHGSLPDARTGEGETVSFKTLSKENLELRDAVKRRTAELENRNRELEIETSLEKVRTVAMGMKKPDDMLDICKTISNQMAQLGVKEIRNVQTAIFYEARGTYMNYEYYAKHDKTFITDVNYKGHKVQMSFGKKMMKGAGEQVREHFSGKKLRDWYDYQKSTNQFADKYLLKADSVNYYWYSLGPVALGLSTYYPITQEEADLFQRFLKVFELAYRRYLDIENAEAQAREARIEASLERVRAITMAMRDSSELSGLIYKLYGELTRLDAKLDRCFIMIVNPNNKGITWWMAGKEGLLAENGFFVPMNEHPSHLMYLDCWKKRKKKWQYLFEGKEKRDWDRFGFSKTELANLPEFIKNYMASVKKIHLSGSSDQFGSIVTGSPEPLPEEQQDIISRFAVAFNQAYIRFLDLQKAEAQAREAEIELSMERVRSKAMAMHDSGDILVTTTVSFEELNKLGIHSIRCGIGLLSKNSMKAQVYASTKNSNGAFQTLVGTRDMNEHPSLIRQYQTWLKQENSVETISDEELRSYYNLLFFKSSTAIPQTSDKKQYGYYFPFADGLFYSWSNKPYTDNEVNILNRFKTIVALTFRRFLDLQKAEAQAREAQIELGLERVRARAMAMQRSDELSELVDTVFRELTKLDFALNWCMINIIDESTMSNTVWAANPDINKAPESYHMLFENYPFHHAMMRGWKEKRTKDVYVLEGREKKVYDEYLFKDTEFRRVPAEAQASSRAMKKYVVSFTFSNFGGLQTVGEVPLSEANMDILSRFGKVFDLTYTRFNDLKKAEAQAREAQIEASLERVRSRTMGMQKSDELPEAATLLFNQVQALGMPAWSAGYCIWNEDRSAVDLWMSSEGVLQPPFTAPTTEDELFIQMRKGFEQGKTLHVVEMGGKTLAKHYKYMRTLPVVGEILESIVAAGFPLPTFQIMHQAYFSKGFLLFITYEPVPESHDIFIRFANVFDQTYTRFLDLKKAEAQAREAQIEASMERVRSRTMAMQKSTELMDVAVLLYNELKHLGVTQQFFETGYVEIDEANKIQTGWTTTPDGNYLEPFNLPLNGEPVLDARYEAWKQRVPVFKQLVSGEALKRTIEFTLPYMGNEEAEEITRNAPDSIIFYCGNFEHGYLSINSDTPLGAEAEALLGRFTRVFEMTYKRFLDLKKSEFQTHQAKIETALEKVRARALAMQQPEELTEVAQVMRYEMGLLGVEELETSSIYIHEEQPDQAECWYAIKDIRVPEKKLVADHFVLNLNDTWVGRQMLDFYQSTEKQISIPMKGSNRKEWINYCSERSKLLDGFYGDVIPERTYHLYKFSNGTIGAATPGNISAESWDLLQRAASVFSLAYSRFKDLTQARTDLQRLKEEKQRAETALADLQTTQKQLIQAEKMASLGELTAGIAHEIQNPLNFVNNFAEVNTELNAEGLEAISSGNLRDAEEILRVLAENNDKILHHGKRADGIVKGMLQHSRTSSGVKESTNINALADEYLRLAYHGLKAKDRSFNASIKTDFDESIGNINIIPQDIGRVLLNLINNAFYAVDEKKKQIGENYEPEVIVTTKLGSNQKNELIISVRDNGNGIPEKIRNKIFQPFFTTKPTGEGTGLGLSLSYDTIKAQGGEIRVDSKEGEGSVFTISIPIA